MKTSFLKVHVRVIFCTVGRVEIQNDTPFALLGALYRKRNIQVSEIAAQSELEMRFLACETFLSIIFEFYVKSYLLIMSTSLVQGLAIATSNIGVAPSRGWQSRKCSRGLPVHQTPRTVERNSATPQKVAVVHQSPKTQYLYFDFCKSYTSIKLFRDSDKKTETMLAGESTTLRILCRVNMHTLYVHGERES